MQISHESPLCLLEESRNYNDYDYALVHLFEKYPEYYDFFKKSLELGRRVILDNSIFELGIAFDTNQFAYWIDELKPTDYIVPDVLDNCNKTIAKFEEWKLKYNKLPGFKIGVVQGKTFDEIIKCYKYMEQNADKIAINFTCEAFWNLHKSNSKNKYLKLMKGRINCINKLISLGLINFKKKHHLLGCALPQEFKKYKGMNWIESVDTSNPIVHTIKNIKYQSTGLKIKEPTKLVDLIETPLDKIDMELLYYNIKQFRKFCEK